MSKHRVRVIGHSIMNSRLEVSFIDLDDDRRPVHVYSALVCLDPEIKGILPTQADVIDSIKRTLNRVVRDRVLKAETAALVHSMFSSYSRR